MMNKTVYVPSHFQPITEGVLIVAKGKGVN